MKRNKSNQTNAPVAAVEADTNTQATVDTAVADLSSDDAVDAALAAIDAEANEQAEVMALADVENVEIPQADTAAVDVATEADEIEALIAEAEAADAAKLLVEEAPLTPTDTDPASTTEEVAQNLAEVTEEDVQDVIEKDADALLAELNAQEEDQQAPVAQAAPKAPRKKKDATPAAPAQPKRDFHSVAAIDPATLKANLDGCAAKKVQEKAQNLIQSIETGKRLSRYTSVAVKRLVADGKVSGKSLTEAMRSEGLSDGTARAQAQQMTALFRIAGIAQPDATAPRELVLADQGLADELMKLAA